MNCTSPPKFLLNTVEDNARIFPSKAMKTLAEFDLLKHAIFTKNTYNYLFKVGKSDLSVGRLYEGHMNALLLIATFGTLAQKEQNFKEAAEGKLFAIWNTETTDEKLQLSKKGEKLILKGSKNFCSGALQIDTAVVTVHTPQGLQMVLINLNEPHDLSEDWSQWNPSGMRASVSCRIDFTGFKIKKEDFLGGTDDYYSEPVFSWGAIRFCAVQLGGAQKITEITVQHLKKNERTENPHQNMRIGKLAILMETGKLWLQKASEMEKDSDVSDLEKINFANMMRTLTLDICEKAIALAEKAVGIQGVLKSHPLERPVRDLRVYLKQAGPDQALANVGYYYTKKTKHA